MAPNMIANKAAHLENNDIFVSNFEDSNASGDQTGVQRQVSGGQASDWIETVFYDERK